jgi:PEGA domain-containing protein
MTTPTLQATSAADAPDRGRARRLWPLAVATGLVLVALAVAFALLLAAHKRTVDALVIVTVPSAAEVIFDGRPLGPAPIRLEDVRVGPHTVRVAKDGFVAAEQQVEVDPDNDDPLEFDLKPIAPPGSVARTPAEQVSEFAALAEDALSRGDLVVPPDRSALYYAEAMLSLDRGNDDALRLTERIRTGLLDEARAALKHRDFAHAKAVYAQVLAAFPNDPEGTSGLATTEEQLRRGRPAGAGGRASGTRPGGARSSR